MDLLAQSAGTITPGAAAEPMKFPGMGYHFLGFLSLPPTPFFQPIRKLWKTRSTIPQECHESAVPRNGGEQP